MRINGVDVIVSEFTSFKTLAALKKESGEIFKHLGEDAEGAAYKELWETMHPNDAKTDPEQ